jgi:uncharacterized protein (DUF2164 family)
MDSQVKQQLITKLQEYIAGESDPVKVAQAQDVLDTLQGN